MCEIVFGPCHPRRGGTRGGIFRNPPPRSKAKNHQTVRLLCVRDIGILFPNYQANVPAAACGQAISSPFNGPVPELNFSVSMPMRWSIET